MEFFLFKLETAYEMRISDWSSDVCSSDLTARKGMLQRRRCHPLCEHQTIRLPIQLAFQVPHIRQRQDFSHWNRSLISIDLFGSGCSRTFAQITLDSASNILNKGHKPGSAVCIPFKLGTR